MQQITISGRIGKDAETRDVQGSPVTSFNVAVDQGYGDRKTTNWFRVSAWGKKGAGAAPYLLKGGVVTVIGELEFGEYDGKPQYNVRASDFTLPPKMASDQRSTNQSRQSDDGWGGGQSGTRSGGGGTQAGFVDDLDADDVPFATCEPIDNVKRRII